MTHSIRFDTRSLQRLIMTLLLIACIGSAVGAQEDVLTAQEDMVWVTMGGDAFERLTATPDVFDRTFTPRSYAAEAGVVVTHLPTEALRSVSELMHTAMRRCSGFIVHDSFEQATAALESVAHGNRLVLPSSFTIGQQTLVQQLAPLLDQNNIFSTIQHLSTFYNNRFNQNASGEQAALWIRDLWQQYAAGRSDVTVATYTHSGFIQPSVILTIAGTSLASEVVVLGGHLDSINLDAADNTDPATIAPGADDNASGIAALSEVIRVLLDNGVTPDRTIHFMGYAAEEVGLLGSGDIATDFSAASTNVVGVMQLDMTGFMGSAEDIALVDDFTNSELTTFIGTLLDTYQPALQWTTTTCGYACSDHASWTNQGFPAVFPFEGQFNDFNQAIHTTNDTLATLGNSAAHALKFARLALAFAVETGLTSSAVCGDGLKEGGEGCDGTDLGGATCSSLGCLGGTLSCAADCTLDRSGCTDCPTVCGDGVCEAGEDCDNCSADCIGGPPLVPGCNNGVCEPGIGEDCVSCAADCNGRQGGKPGNRFCCGDGDGEGPIDCSDSRCNSNGFICSDVLPSSACCGDLVCEGSEDTFNCALDCGGCLASEPGVELTCDDGADNDCDQLFDCDDPDCANDSACACSLGASGDACSSNADCCSGKCKGNSTCR